MSPRCLADQALATATASVGAHHLGRGSGLVDESLSITMAAAVASGVEAGVPSAAG
jgi:hypothetical protein